VASGAISGNYVYIIGGLLLGFFSYGLSVLFYIYAQRDLGAARTSAYYAVAPFVGVVFSWILLGQNLSLQFFVGFIIMICATYLMTRDGQSKNDRIEVRNEEQNVGKTS
jgi:drug/metabolite transporter (DMT)-like permease